MEVDYRAEFKKFYRVEAKSGNRDFVKVNGKWIVCSGPQLPDDTIKRIGEAIEVSESLGFPNPKQKKGLF